MSSQKRPIGLRKMFKFWFPLLGYSAIIFCVSSLPRLKPPIEGFNIDKLWHVLEYAPFGFLAARALYYTTKADRRMLILGLTTLMTLIYGISDELHQLYVEGRFSSVFDVMADTLGGFLGGWVFVRFQYQAKKD